MRETGEFEFLTGQVDVFGWDLSVLVTDGVMSEKQGHLGLHESCTA